MRKRKEKGFTLVELLVVIVIISLLGAVLATKVIGRLGKAKWDIAKTQIAKVDDAIQQFYVTCGRYPSDSEGLDALINRPEDIDQGKWQQPYLKPSQLKDPWGRPFEYRQEGELNPGGFDVISYGADGQEGGEGENADIYND